MKKITEIIRRYIKESFDTLLTDQIASLAFGLLTTWIFGMNLSKLNESIPIYVKFYILAICFFVVYLASTVIQLRPHRYKFHFISVEVVVEYLGKKVNIYNTYKLKTNRFKVSKMYTKITWFSDEKFDFESTSKGYEIEKKDKLGNDYEYYVIFSRPMHFWQSPEEIRTVVKGTNRNRQFKNFFWYDVICPTSQLIIEVRIPRQYCTQKVRLKSFLDHEGTVGSNESTIDYSGVYRWEISNPKLGWSYKFEWEWSDEELAKIKAKNNQYN